MNTNPIEKGYEDIIKRLEEVQHSELINNTISDYLLVFHIYLLLFSFFLH